MGLSILAIILHFTIITLILCHLSILRSNAKKTYLLNIETQALIESMKYQLNNIERHTTHSLHGASKTKPEVLPQKKPRP